MASQTENLHLKLLGTSLADRETYFEDWRQTINGEIDDSNMQIIDRAFKELADSIDDIRYVAIAINTFTANPPSAEKGSTVSTVQFTYGLNKVPATLKFGSEDLTPAKSGTKTITDQSITANKTWTLTASDNGSATIAPKTVTRNVTLSFVNKAYWGVGAIPSTLNSAFILGLEGKTLTTTRVRTFTVTAASGQYIWYAYPASMGDAVFTVGGYEGGFENPQKIQFTNASGYTEQYNVYRSTNPVAGETEVEVS